MNIYLDIETIPTKDPAVIALIADGVNPPASLKKKESIEAWIENEKQAAIDEAVAKTSFDGAYGQICCIGWAFGDDEIHTTYAGDVEKDGVEKELIERFFNAVIESHDYNTGRPPVFIGHNITSFDLRFILQRAIINGIKPPQIIPFHAKPWDAQVFDTMTYFAGAGNRIKLDKLAKVLGLEGKQGMDGADVWPAYQAGRIEEIAAYCADDVRQTREIHQRMTFAKAA